MISRWPLWLALAGLVLAGPGRADPVEACPGEQGCQVEGGHYRLVLPDAAPAAPLAALMYFHGWQGSAEETAADPGLRALATRLGIALIAPDGAGRTWSYPGSPGRHRDEFAFVSRVLDDVAARFPVDSRRIMASGFSQGGSMVWYLACRMPGRFRAFAPVAGAFWEPLPASCTGPRPALVHTHGTTDGTVPLAGRALRSGFRQGDVFRSLAILDPQARAATVADFASSDALSCLRLSAPGTTPLELCLHPGGHVVDPAWIERAWRLTMGGEGPRADHLSVKR
ncbi:alpha/beta hydrolase family esterase [Bosea sp. (in: a-proteobacteria)]|uniref:alpha/beta hydrolase family esterase n=1 Tax=Bosea sp. (in: a-proteobacteria) TaxID=1871050 RepID=UPI003F7234E2